MSLDDEVRDVLVTILCEGLTRRNRNDKNTLGGPSHGEADDHQLETGLS